MSMSVKMIVKAQTSQGCKEMLVSTFPKNVLFTKIY